jgi:hypothetical protein
VTPLGRTGIRTRQIVRKLAPTGRGVEFVSAPGPATPRTSGPTRSGEEVSAVYWAQY